MNKRLFKILLPLTALALSSCALLDGVVDFLNAATDTTESSDSGDNSGTQTGTDTTPSTPGQTDPGNTDPVDPVTPTNPYADNPSLIDMENTLPLQVGEKKSLTVRFVPSTVKNKELTWTTDKEEVATVVDGEVTGVSVGTATIMAKTRNTEGKVITAQCKVVVTAANTVEKTQLLYTYDDYMANNASNIENAPLEGDTKLLIIPVWFSDSDTFIRTDKKADVRSDMETLFLGTNEETGWRSVKSYYAQESAEKLNLTGTVTDWYNTGTSYTAYAEESAGLSATATLVHTASKWYFDNHSSDPRTNYDTNGDGYLDGVILIYAAPDSQSLNVSGVDNLWAYCYWSPGTPSLSKPAPNVFFWGSYDFMYSPGPDAYARTGLASYGHGDTRFCNIDAHCFIHEMGHVLGLEDYYDYSGQHNPAGGFSMQDMNVGGHDPYSVMAYGWADPYIPTETTTITISDFQSSHDIILLANHTVNSPFDEYLLLELYSPTGLNELDSNNAYRYGYPQGPQETGLRVWHVDGRLYNGGYTLVTNPTLGYVTHAMSNTYYNDEIDSNVGSNRYVSPLGKAYADYNLLQLLHNEVEGEELSSYSLFYGGDSFSMATHSSQFVQSGRMNDGNALGWSFKVDALDAGRAVISVQKL